MCENVKLYAIKMAEQYKRFAVVKAEEACWLEQLRVCAEADEEPATTVVKRSSKIWSCHLLTYPMPTYRGFPRFSHC